MLLALYLTKPTDRTVRRWHCQSSTCEKWCRGFENGRMEIRDDDRPVGPTHENRKCIRN